MRDAFRTSADAPGLSPSQVDELVRLHLHHPLCLTGYYAPVLNGDFAALVTELLRLARLGAVAEAEILLDRSIPTTALVGAERQRWARETGLR